MCSYSPKTVKWKQYKMPNTVAFELRVWGGGLCVFFIVVLGFFVVVFYFSFTKNKNV